MASEIYRKHPDDLTDQERSRLPAFVALRILENEEAKIGGQQHDY